MVNIVLLAARTDVETLLLRTPGVLPQKVDETHVSNLYNYQVINKTNEEFSGIPARRKVLKAGPAGREKHLPPTWQSGGRRTVHHPGQ